MSRRPDVISLFGEVEVIVAKQMMAEGRGVGLLAPCPCSKLRNTEKP